MTNRASASSEIYESASRMVDVSTNQPIAAVDALEKMENISDIFGNRDSRHLSR